MTEKNPLIETAKVSGEKDVAVHGYDCVSYFSEGGPKRGKKENEHIWQGVKWWFETEENKQLFIEDPEKYAPQYGGFCAFAMCKFGTKVGISPERYLVNDGKLYLNANVAAAMVFSAKDTTIAKGDKKWKNIQDKHTEKN